MNGPFGRPGRGRAPRPDANVRALEVEVGGLSQKGLYFECAQAVLVGQQIEIDLPCVVSKRAKVVWRDAGRCVCEFVVPLRFQDVARCTVHRTRIVVVD